MARTGKKSVRSKPAAMKKQIVQNRRIKKTSGEKDRGLKEALDKELTSEDLTIRKLVDRSKTTQKASDQAKVDHDGLLASFDQLRGL